MTIRFLRPAKADLDDAAAYYNRQREGLGDEFVWEVDGTIQRILEQPNAWGQKEGYTAMPSRSVQLRHHLLD